MSKRLSRAIFITFLFLTATVTVLLIRADTYEEVVQRFADNESSEVAFSEPRSWIILTMTEDIAYEQPLEVNYVDDDDVAYLKDSESGGG